jgi:hypothetical protein
MIYYDSKEVPFEILKGKTLKSIENKGEELIFITTEGERFRQIYHPDCCASCSVEEIHGDLEDLVGSPILMAEQVSDSTPDESKVREEYEREKQEAESVAHHFYYDDFEEYKRMYDKSQTWTFYKAATIKGSVTIRWYGSSNGYYSETPTFEQLKDVKK